MLRAPDLPVRNTIFTEASSSGSPDLPVYMDELSDTIGEPSLVIALDSTCGNYDQLWVTTSLRGMLIGDLKYRFWSKALTPVQQVGSLIKFSFAPATPITREDEHSGAICPLS